MVNLPDSPKAPAWLQKIQFITDPISYLESNRDRYGDIFNAPVIGNPKLQLLVSHPEGLKKLFKNEGKEFYAPSDKIMKFMTGEQAISYLEGDAHKRDRKLLMPSFQPEKISAHGQTICELTEQVFSQLIPGNIFSALEVVRQITLEILLETLFGIHKQERFQQFKQLMIEYMSSFDKPLVAIPLLIPSLRKDWGLKNSWGYLCRLQQKIDQLLYTEISERRTQYDPDRTDILTLLLSAKDEEGNQISAQKIRDELMTLLFGGYETTTFGISWALYWIYQHPEVHEKLLQELNTLNKDSDSMTIFKLPYLTAVCYESLRIYPPLFVNFPRAVKKPVEFMGYQLEPGTLVYASIY